MITILFFILLFLIVVAFYKNANDKLHVGEKVNVYSDGAEFKATIIEILPGGKITETLYIVVPRKYRSAYKRDQIGKYF